jgi:HEPN domain-containing protein
MGALRGPPGVEKALKAVYVKLVEATVPKSHNLLEMAQKAGLELSDEQRELFDELTAFNIRAQYPDYKQRFYKKATRDFTERYIFKIRELREWLISLVKD